jgi:Fe(3+) dicitrate transport protein
MKQELLTILMAGSLFSIRATAQQDSSKVFHDDSTHPKHKYLQEVTVVGRNSASDIHQLPEIVGTSIYAGKKNALIVLDNVKGNIVTNTMRQVMAKVPGIHVWENDGSGIQIGIAARGLSPNRSWEFNIRQNGYDIAADPFGYPEAYYNPQLQAVQRIEVIRGQGALQYGPQFGGMVNYILRNGSEINKPFEFETQQTIGSNGLFNTYNAVGGDTKKFHYYGFFDHRNADGWRQNSRYFTNAGFGTFTYRLTDKFSVTGEVMQSHIRSQQPGGLTDAQIKQNAQQSFRSRNWFDITWTTPAITFNYQFNEHARINAKLFSVIGNRSSIGYLNSITIKDSINAVTMDYNNRKADVDRYRNYGAEVRGLADYSIGKMKHTVSGGLRIFRGNTFRLKEGKGDTGFDFNTNIIGDFSQDLQMVTNNVAGFVENVFRISNKLLFIPGVRFEHVNAAVDGRLGFNSNGSEKLANHESRSRNFMLAGLGSEYHVSNKTEFYGNFSQAYRPMLFSDLAYSPTTDVVDPDLKDAKGYNFDLGYRGKVKNFLFFDVSGFYLKYNNRIGAITQQKADGNFYTYRTNIGNSHSKGMEALVELNPLKALGKNVKNFDISVFGSYSYTDARYENLKVITKNSSNQLVESNLENNRVENAPYNILRSGATFGYKGFSLTGQLSWVDKSFSDANNTVNVSANGQTGLIPSYVITDLTAAYKFSKNLNIKAGVNNLADARYFTRRSGGYPGPGALPSDGRNFFVGIGAQF